MDCEGWLVSYTRPAWDGPMAVVLKNGNRGRVRAMQTCDNLPALLQVQFSDDGVCEVREGEIDHYLTPPEPEDRKPEPSSRLVHLPAVQSFGRLQADKWLLLKTLEEAAELVEAGKAYLKADTAARRDLARDDMTAEWADVLQTLANTATAFDITDGEIEQAVSDCLERNRERGRL